MVQPFGPRLFGLGILGSPARAETLGASVKGGRQQSGRRRLLRRPRGEWRPNPELARCGWVAAGPSPPRARFPPPGSRTRRDRRRLLSPFAGDPSFPPQLYSPSPPHGPGRARTLAWFPPLGSARTGLGSLGRCSAAPSALAPSVLAARLHAPVLLPVPASSAFLTRLEQSQGLSLFTSLKPPANSSNPYLAFFSFLLSSSPPPPFKILFVSLPTRLSGFGGLETANSTASGFNFGGFGLTANPAVNFNIGNFGVSTTSATPFNFGNSLASAGRYAGRLCNECWELESKNILWFQSLGKNSDLSNKERKFIS